MQQDTPATSEATQVSAREQLLARFQQPQTPAESAQEAPAADAAPAPADEPKGENRKLMKALAETQKAQSELLKIKSAYEELHKLVEEAKSDPRKALKLANTDFEKLAQDAFEGKFKAVDEPEAPLSEEARKVKELEDRLAAIESEKQELASKAQLQDIKQSLDQSELFPVLASLEWAPARLQTLLRQKQDELGDEFSDEHVREVAEQFQSAVSADVGSVLSNERAAKAFFDANPAMKETVARVLGLAAAKKSTPTQQDKTGTRARGNGPSALSAAQISEIPARLEKAPKETEEQRKQRWVKQLSSRLA